MVTESQDTNQTTGKEWSLNLRTPTGLQGNNDHWVSGHQPDYSEIMITESQDTNQATGKELSLNLRTPTGLQGNNDHWIWWHQPDYREIMITESQDKNQAKGKEWWLNPRIWTWLQEKWFINWYWSCLTATLVHTEGQIPVNWRHCHDSHRVWKTWGKSGKVIVV